MSHDDGALEATRMIDDPFLMFQPIMMVRMLPSSFLRITSSRIRIGGVMTIIMEKTGILVVHVDLFRQPKAECFWMFAGEKGTSTKE